MKSNIAYKLANLILVLLIPIIATGQGYDNEESFSSENDKLIIVNFKQRSDSSAEISIKNGSQYILSSAYVGCFVKQDVEKKNNTVNKWHFVDIFDAKNPIKINLLPGKTITKQIQTDGKLISSCTTGTLNGYKIIGSIMERPPTDYSSIVGKRDGLSPEMQESADCQNEIVRFLKFDPLTSREISGGRNGIYHVEWIDNGRVKRAKLKCMRSRWLTEVGYYN